jgi:hypothetical protein
MQVLFVHVVMWIFFVFLDLDFYLLQVSKYFKSSKINRVVCVTSRFVLFCET